MAPEVHGLPSGGGDSTNGTATAGYTIAADVWSLGIVLYTLCSKNAAPPDIWHDKDAAMPLVDRVNAALGSLAATTTSHRVLTLMSAMLVEDP